MDLLIYGLALATLLSTLVGGLLILKFKSKLPYFFSFAAGSIVAVAFLDILPESLETASNVGIPIRIIMLTIIASFFLYSLLEKYFATHSMEEEEEAGHEGHNHGHVLGPIGAASLVIHSFFDGAAIGVAFQVSASAGIIVAMAVILHDMTDGINTVIVMLRNKQPVKNALVFLGLDAVAPIIGLLLTSLIAIPESALAFILAFFVGEFLYIGASTLVPEARSHPSKKTIIIMAAGMLLIAVLTSLV